MTTRSVKIFVRDLIVQAEIGIHDHEHGRTQPLLLEVELSLIPHPIVHFSDTVDYEQVVIKAREVAESGHFNLVETFADRLGRALLSDGRVRTVRVRVEKPEALAPDAIAAVEIVLEQD